MVLKEMLKKLYRCGMLIAMIALFTGCAGEEQSSSIIKELKVNYRTNPLSIDEQPQFSWKMEDSVQGQKQTAYQIMVADSQENLEKRKYIWDSGKTESDMSIGIPYAGDVLDSENRYYWQVAVWDKDGKKALSKEEAFFETGITDGDWAGAEWLCIPEEEVEVQEENYQITYDFYMKSLSYSGFVWGADKRSYGKHMICAVDTLGEAFSLCILQKDGDRIIDEKKYDLKEFAFVKNEFLQTIHSMKIVNKDKKLFVYIDETLVAETTLTEANEIGQIGLWSARGAYYAYYDNIEVVNDSGVICYQEDFSEKSNTIFAPYYMRVVDGFGEASSGYHIVPGGEEPAPMFRKEFEVEKEITSARLYASSFGIYQIYMNGNKIEDEYFAPGQSEYSKEVYYRTYDVTQQLCKDENAIGVMLGHGRYDRAKGTWGDTLAFSGKLVITYDDGSKQTLVTDKSWKCYNNGPVRTDDMYTGEFYDAGYEVDGWTKAGFVADDWEAVQIYNADTVLRVATDSEPMRCVQELKPITISEPLDGTYVYDFGQNINGMCRIAVKGEPGQVITLRYAEALNEERLSNKDDAVGTVYTENLCTAHNTDYYVIKGTEEEIYEPNFVCRGFRYVQVTGLEKALETDEITALVLTSDLDRTGYFECSDESMNKLYQSIYWTQIDNYIDIPVDCPQRDERLGWSGDAQVFAKTASYNADVYQFLRQYTNILRLEQSEEGYYPERVLSTEPSGGANGWSDAGVIIVWELYQQYGSREIIHENYEAMCKYVDYLVNTSDNYLRSHEGYSDHNAVSTPEHTLTNTAQCAYVYSILAKMSKVIGEDSLAEKYENISEQYKKAWQDKFIQENGSIECWLQTAYALGLSYELYPEELRNAGAECLNNAVIFSDYHINTGYVGTPHLLPVLCDYGYADTAYKLIQQTTYPSWNYMLSMGATTMTERWESYYDNPDGTYGINGSLNHYGLGTVAAWLYQDVLGIRRDESNPGYKHFYIEPVVGGGLTFAKGSYESVYGTIVSEWKVEGNELVFRFVIPANTSATVTLPSLEYQNMELEAGEYEYRVVM